MDCGICIEAMKTESYLPPSNEDKIDDKDPTCLRLKCGHAYHTECIVMAFRQRQGCAVCREQTIVNIDDIIMNNNNDLLEVNDNNLIINLDEFFGNVDETANEFSDIENKLQFLRTTNYYVQKARHDQNLVLRRYNEYCENLKILKRKKMKEFMTKFRRDNRSKFKKVVKDVRSWMNNTKEIELQFLRQMDVTEEQIQRYLQFLGTFTYSPEYLPRSLQDVKDPIHLRFWVP